MKSERIVLSLVGLAALTVIGCLVLLGMGKTLPSELLALAATIAGGVLGWLTRGEIGRVTEIIDRTPEVLDD